MSHDLSYNDMTLRLHSRINEQRDEEISIKLMTEVDFQRVDSLISFSKDE